MDNVTQTVYCVNPTWLYMDKNQSFKFDGKEINSGKKASGFG